MQIINYFRELFAGTWTETEDLSRRSQAAGPGKLDTEIIWILVYTAIGITVTRYFGHTTDYLDSIIKTNPSGFDLWFCSFFFGSEAGRFHSMLFWVSFIIMFYLVFPVLIIKFVFRKKLSSYGFYFRDIHKDYPLFIIMLLVMLPLVYFASSTEAFQEKYPLFKPGTNFNFFIWWQMAYFLQFIAVEFFFRGFILHGLKQRFGVYAIFVMTVPYCLVHLGKPFGETIAAVFAGIVLGTLSLRSRSIILGVVIHYTIAVTMDLFALWRTGFL